MREKQGHFFPESKPDNGRLKKLVVYNHGKESAPWGEKTRVFAEVAERYGYQVKSPDYRGQPDPDQRIEQLLAMNLSDYDEVVLVGSSMGGYVATVASATIKPSGLFLLAPAFYLAGYQQTEFHPPVDKTLVIHGWQDDIVPPENAWKFCRRYRIALKMLDADHRLMSVITAVAQEFERFLAGLYLV